nr:MAG TPA: hypothetical protein [Caudoviricetes sp.]
MFFFSQHIKIYRFNPTPSILSFKAHLSDSINFGVFRYLTI